MIEHLFGGNGACALTDGGRLLLPHFVLKSFSDSPAPHTLLLGCHEGDPCLVAYPKSFQARLFADLERRRILEEAVAPHAHHDRARRLFGYVEEVSVGADRSLVLPPFMRRRAGIGGLALCVGTGATFEIWDAERALAEGGSELRELAAWHLELNQAA